MKSITKHRQCWQPHRSNQVFGIVGDLTVFRKPPHLRAVKAHETIEIQSRRTQPVQFVCPSICEYLTRNQAEVYRTKRGGGGREKTKTMNIPGFN